MALLADSHLRPCLVTTTMEEPNGGNRLKETTAPAVSSAFVAVAGRLLEAAGRSSRLSSSEEVAIEAEIEERM